MPTEIPDIFTYELFLELLEPWINDRRKWTVPQRTTPIYLDITLPEEDCQIFCFERKAGKIYFANPLQGASKTEITNENFTEIGQQLWDGNAYLLESKPPQQLFHFQPVAKKINQVVEEQFTNLITELASNVEKQTSITAVLTKIIAEYASQKKDIPGIVQDLKSQQFFAAKATSVTDSAKTIKSPTTETQEQKTGFCITNIQ